MAAGLRLGEACRLQPRHIDSARMQIRVEAGKGRKDRYTLLSPRLLQELRDYWRMFRPQRVALLRARPAASPWPAHGPEDFLHARKRAGLPDKGGIHSLRHSFATHLMESGVEITVVQRLLGHSSLSTTSVYLHVRQERLAQIKSPLQLLDLARAKDPGGAGLTPGLSHGLQRGPPAQAWAEAGRSVARRPGRLPAHACRTTIGAFSMRCWRVARRRWAATVSVPGVRAVRILCPHACRNRHCPLCQGQAARQWLAEQEAALLPVPYFHLVFTLPHVLNPLIRQNQRALYPLLFASRQPDVAGVRAQPLPGPAGHHRRAAHLEPDPAGPLPHPLHRHRRGLVRGWRALGPRSGPLPVCRAGALRRLPRQVLRRPPSNFTPEANWSSTASLGHWLSRRRSRHCCASRPPQVGGLHQAALCRTAASAGLSVALHPSGRHQPRRLLALDRHRANRRLRLEGLCRGGQGTRPCACRWGSSSAASACICCRRAS